MYYTLLTNVLSSFNRKVVKREKFVFRFTYNNSIPINTTSLIIHCLINKSHFIVIKGISELGHEILNTLKYINEVNYKH